MILGVVEFKEMIVVDNNLDFLILMKVWMSLYLFFCIRMKFFVVFYKE